mgnify:CR=1 FL=1
MSLNDVMDILNYQDTNKKVFELLIKKNEKGQNRVSLYDKVEDL